MKKIEAVNIVGPIGADLGPGRNPAGAIVAANEERFTATFLSEPLTAYALGWRDPNNIQATLDSIAPPVTVPRRFEYKEATNAEAFLSETDDIRAIGADFKLVQYTGVSTNQKTLNKGLTISLDKDEIVAGSEEQAVRWLTERIMRNDLRRAVNALSTAATNTAKTWDTTAGKDPDQDVLADIITANTARGTPCDVIAYGQTVWQKRALAHRAQSTAGGFASASVTEAALAGLMGVDRVVVSREVYQSSKTAKTQIVNNLVLMYAAMRGASKDDPSNVKRFVTPAGAGGVQAYRQEYAKRVEISVEHYSNVVVTSTLGIRMFTVS